VFWYILALMLFALGLMSKPMLVTLPFVLLLLDYWPLKRFQIPHFKFQRFLGYPRHPTPPARASQSPKVSWFVLEKLPFFAFSAISCWITLALQRGAAEQNAAILIEDRLANAIISYSRYLGKLFWPTKLTILYPHPISSYDPSSVWLDWQIGVAALALFIVSLGCLWQVRSRPYLAVGWFWFLGTLVPVIGLVQVGEQAMADRYTYIPLIGPVIGLVWFVSELPLLDPVRRRLFSILATVIVIGCTMLTRRQLNYWRNTVTLFAHALEITPNNASAEVSLGVGLEKQGKPTEAMTHYRRALALNPSYAIAHYNVGQLLRKNGAWAEAAEHYSIVVDLKPYDVPARVNFANALESLGRDEEAIVQFEKTLSLDPNLVEALNNLAWLLASDADARLRNGARAVELAQHACELTHFREVIMVGTLAAAYAEAGRFPEAVATAEKACALASKLGEPELLARNQQLLEGYRSGRPYHEVGH
jgi:tetratricopeptide (TPR) repeat protein